MTYPAAARTHAEDLAAFVTASPTSFHAAHDVEERLVSAGFRILDEGDAWNLEPAQSYVVRRDGAVIGFTLPASANATTGFAIVGTHTDSPGFRLKPSPNLRGHGGWSQLGVEVYGGPILASWMDRDLRVAGRVIDRDGRSHLVSTPPLARIPHLAIHLDRSANDALTIDRQRHTQPVWSFDDDTTIDEILSYETGLAPVDLAGCDLFLADAQPPALIGHNESLLASGRLDNLLSTHAAVQALISTPASDRIPVVAAFDHEEVGSASRTGAGGPFLEQVLTRIGVSLGAGEDERARAWAASFHVSSDVGHAVHPNHAEKHDPTVRPVIGGGPILKVNANQRYATDGRGEAVWRQACERAGVPFQAFVSNNAIPCGSTIGPISAERLGIATVDVGVAILSMHSARELTAVVDPWYLSRAMGAFFGA